MTSTDTKSNIVIGTRGSALALWQANYIKSLVEKLGLSAELKIIKTTGDKVQNRFLNEIGGKGLFIKELEESLLRGDIDIAMHSLKDVPAKLDPSFQLTAILPRHCESDLFIVHPNKADVLKCPTPKLDISYFQKHKGLSIATGSLRRKALLHKADPSIEVVPIRGNVDTRIHKLNDSDWDGLILAKASIDRLALHNKIVAFEINPEWFIPSPAQGALAIESRVDHPLNEKIAELDCSRTHYAVSIERLILKKLGGDCTLPFAAFVRYDNTSNKWKGEAAVFDNKGNDAYYIYQWSTPDLSDTEEVAKAIINGLLEANVNSILKALKLAPISL